MKIDVLIHTFSSPTWQPDIRRFPLSAAEMQYSLDQLASSSTHLFKGVLKHPGHALELPRYIFFGPNHGGERVKIGIFAGIHGDEKGGVLAVESLLEFLDQNPEAAAGYDLYCYPICNPSGCAANRREAVSGKDLNREFWKNSTEPEVRLLEREIRERNFQGLISLHADDTSDGVYGFVRGAVLTRHLLEPALRAAEDFLPRNQARVIDGFPAENGIITQCYDGILRSPPELDPMPFEIILETPQRASDRIQAQALQAGILSILSEYQKLLAFAANL